jgi:hypothetical protein
VALNISDLDFDNYVKRVRSLNLELFEGRNRISGEGKSLYFSEYDNHLFELHTGTLGQRLEPMYWDLPFNMRFHSDAADHAGRNEMVSMKK